MTEIWNKYTYLNTDTDALIEVTALAVYPIGSREHLYDSVGPAGSVLNDSPYVLLSVEDATIQPTNERNTMETQAPYTYNANTLVTYKSIKDGEVSYPTLKVNELEAILDNPTLDVIETMPNGEHITHQMKRTDVSELFRKRQFDVAKINDLQSKVNKIIDNLTAEGWYHSNMDKDGVLAELCAILDHEPKQTVTITAQVSVEVSYDIPLDEVEDFDARYFLQDSLSIDSWNGDVVVESFDVEDADVDWS
jgi:hypothetical protein